MKAQVHNFDAGQTDQVLQLNVFLSPQALRQIQRLQEQQAAAEQFRHEEQLREQQAHYLPPREPPQPERAPIALEGEEIRADELIEIKRLLRRMRESGNHRDPPVDEGHKPIIRPIYNYTESMVPQTQVYGPAYPAQPIENMSDYRQPPQRYELTEHAQGQLRHQYAEVQPKQPPEQAARIADSNRLPPPSHARLSIHPVNPIAPVQVPDYSRPTYQPSQPPSIRKRL